MGDFLGDKFLQKSPKDLITFRLVLKNITYMQILPWFLLEELLETVWIRFNPISGHIGL